MKFYDHFRYDVLKVLLSMDGLKGIQVGKAEGRANGEQALE